MRLLLCVSTILIVGCGTETADSERPPVTDETALREQLMQADRDFAAATRERGVEGWVPFFVPQGVQVRNGEEIVGRTAIREVMTPVFADTSWTLVWEPIRAEIGAGSDLAYTLGDYEVVASDTTRGEGGVIGRGKYLTVWRRQPDGSWKVEADIGSPAPISTP